MWNGNFLTTAVFFVFIIILYTRGVSAFVVFTRDRYGFDLPSSSYFPAKASLTRAAKLFPTLTLLLPLLIFLLVDVLPA